MKKNDKNIPFSMDKKNCRIYYKARKWKKIELFSSKKGNIIRVLRPLEVAAQQSTQNEPGDASTTCYAPSKPHGNHPMT